MRIFFKKKNRMNIVSCLDYISEKKLHLIYRYSKYGKSFRVFKKLNIKEIVPYLETAIKECEDKIIIFESKFCKSWESFETKEELRQLYLLKEELSLKV